jgi:4,5-DOPA dioxygenase extradiol
MLSIDAGLTGAAWHRIADSLPRPRAIVVASAHWLTTIPAVSTTANPATIHDFYGFPKALFKVQYTPPGAPLLAQDVARRLLDAGFEGGIDAERGLDHGAWVPLMNMYPDADVPTFQLAIQPRATPEHHWRVGRALAALRDDGVLILGSGSITHNLRELTFGAAEGAVTHPYVSQFTDWMHEKLVASPDTPALLDYRRQVPGAQRAHPTDEHLLPIFVCLGAGAADSAIERLHAGYTEGGLAMDVYAFH